jgi:branched-chain amino acid aminotransferase
MKTVKKIWMDGKFVDWKKANVHVLTHGLHYGLAIFEGMRCYDTPDGPAVFRMKEHYQRFRNGCKSYKFSCKYPVEKLCEATRKLIKVNKLKECYVRPITFTGYDRIGLDMTGVPFSMAICAIPFGTYFGDKAEKGITCGISSWRRMKGSILSPHVKASANYLNSVIAKKEAIDEGYDEAIMLIDNGHVSEGSAENLFVVKDGKLITPPLSDGILAGITRDSLMVIAKEMGIPLEERSMLRDELYTADEVFLCGTAAEVTPVIQVDHIPITKGPGKVTKKLKSAFFNVVRGKDERFVKWLDYI